MNSSKFCQGTEVPHPGKNSSELWISMTKWSHLLNLRHTHGCFHMCIYLNYFVIKQKVKKKTLKINEIKNVLHKAWPLENIHCPICTQISCSVAFLEEDVNLGLFSSDMSQMAKQRSYSSKSSLVGPLSLSELPKEYEWPKGSCVIHHNRVGTHENLFTSWSSQLNLRKFSPKPPSWGITTFQGLYKS